MEKVYPETVDRRLMGEMMMRRMSSAKMWVAAAMLAAGVMARGQAAPPAPNAAPQKDTAQKFPFPGEQPSTADRPAGVAPDAPGAQDAPAAPQVKTPKIAPPAYPGDPDAAAVNPPGESSSSSSSSSQPYDPTADDAGPLKDAGSSGEDTKLPAPPTRMGRKKLPKVNPETPESRASEDLTVADFYMNDGNYAAAYLRAKDATQYQPNDAYAHFTLAEAARKLGKRDEAKEHYEQVLKLDPIPKQKKASERALAEMASTAKK